MTEQLGLDLPGIPVLGREDFLVAPSNIVAFHMIESWRTWNSGKMVLTGPVGSGKTHLVHVWAAACGAQIIKAASLKIENVPELVKGPVAVEDLPEISGDSDAQTALFHLHNLALAEGHPLLLTGTGSPQDWGLSLPDLVSRVAASQSAALLPPDDSLLAAVLVKLFSDRQLTPHPTLIAYLIRRMDRSFTAAQDMVATLDRASLAQKRPVSRTLAVELLDNSSSFAV